MKLPAIICTASACLGPLCLAGMPTGAFARYAEAVVPYSVTFVTTGVTGPNSDDGQDFFGGGTLATGLAYVDTLTVLFTDPQDYVWGKVFDGVSGAGTDTLTLNGYTVTLTGDAGILNSTDLGPDRRAGDLDETSSSYYALRDYNAVERLPSLWASDPSAENIFLDNTVACASLGSYGCSGTFYALPISGSRTDITLNGATITSSTIYTTALVYVPEPQAWAMLIVGVGAVGAALRRRRIAPTPA
jgi:hypothetical protein